MHVSKVLVSEKKMPPDDLLGNNEAISWLRVRKKPCPLPLCWTLPTPRSAKTCLLRQVPVKRNYRQRVLELACLPPHLEACCPKHILFHNWLLQNSLQLCSVNIRWRYPATAFGGFTEKLDSTPKWSIE